MTEKYWQERKYWNKRNDKNLNPLIENTYNEKRAIAPNKHFKELYAICLKGSLDLKLWEISDDLTVDDMGLLACRDVGCELNYCQTSLSDPYEKPFQNCDSQTRAFYSCISREVDNYNSIDSNIPLKDYLKVTLENKKKNKYSHLFINKPLAEKVFYDPFPIYKYPITMGGKVTSNKIKN